MEPLKNPIKEYAWGSRTAIAELTGRPSPSPGPEAEMWLGAHPSGPSQLKRDGVWAGLDDLITRDPERELGAATVARFGARLPYLLKLIAVERPLSLQVHPTEEQAKEGFGWRGYVDPWPKPELIYALTPFSMLAGFRPAAELVRLLDGLLDGPLDRPLRVSYAPSARIPLPRMASEPAVVPQAGPVREGRASEAGVLEVPAPAARVSPELPVAGGAPVAGAAREAWAAIRDRALAGDRRGVLRAVLEVPRDVLPWLVERCAEAAEHAPDETAYPLVGDLAARYPGDPACLAPLLLCHHRLEPGEAMFLGAGVLHSYLHGFGVEIMGGSDNVLRAGLTPKPIDVPELLRVVEPSNQARRIVPAESSFDPPCPEFRLGRIEVEPGGGDAAATTGHISHLMAGGVPRILLCTRGGVVAETATTRTALGPGGSVFVPAGTGPVRVQGEGTVLYAEPGLG